MREPLAVPFVSDAVARVVPVFVRRDTLPDGVAVPLDALTAIEYVTCVAGVTAVALRVSVVVVATAAAATTDTAGELLAVKLLSPLYSAVTV